MKRIGAVCLLMVFGWYTATASALDVPDGEQKPNAFGEQPPPCDDDAPPPVCENGWIAAEYLLWTLKKSNVPPLVTSGVGASTGALNQIGTSVLFGGAPLSSGSLDGGRITAGYALCKDSGMGIEASFFRLEEANRHFTVSSTGDVGTAILARPFIDAASGTETSFLVASPGVASGTITVDTRTQFMGAELNLAAGVIASGPVSCRLLGGFRYLDLKDRLNIMQASSVLPVGVGTATTLSDLFSTKNEFYGGQFGIEATLGSQIWQLELRGTLALGQTQETLNQNGVTTIADPVNGTVVLPGGLLVSPNNIGRFKHSQFAAAPEFRIRLAYQFSPHWSADIGYTFLYLTDVARVGEQINRTVVTPSPLTTTVTFQQDTAFWAQGLTAGVTFRF